MIKSYRFLQRKAQLKHGGCNHQQLPTIGGTGVGGTVDDIVVEIVPASLTEFLQDTCELGADDAAKVNAWMQGQGCITPAGFAEFVEQGDLKSAGLALWPARRAFSRAKAWWETHKCANAGNKRKPNDPDSSESKRLRPGAASFTSEGERGGGGAGGGASAGDQSDTGEGKERFQRGAFKGVINISDTLLKQRNDISPGKGKMENCSPPERGWRRSGRRSRRGSGGGDSPISPFRGEISYRCFER